MLADFMLLLLFEILLLHISVSSKLCGTEGVAFETNANLLRGLKF